MSSELGAEVMEYPRGGRGRVVLISMPSVNLLLTLGVRAYCFPAMLISKVLLTVAV